MSETYDILTSKKPLPTSWSLDFSEKPPPLPTSSRPSQRTNPFSTPPLQQRHSTIESTRRYSALDPSAYNERPPPKLPASLPPPLPPSIPPKSAAVRQSQSAFDFQAIETPQPKMIQEDDYNVVSESMSLRQLTDKHQNDFPVKVVVSAGIFGATEKDTFSDGDLLNIHFVKQVKVAVIEKCGGKRVRVPLNSDLRLGLVYNPEDNLKGAVNGYFYRTANQLMAQKPLPKLVSTGQTFKGTNEDYSVEENDILALKEVRSNRLFGAKQLICTRLNRIQVQKKLPENCIGGFTTKPSELKLFLPEIVNHFELPVKALAFLTTPTEGDWEESPFNFGELVTVVAIESEKTLIATCAFDENPTTSRSDSPMFDIPIDIPIMEVQIIEPKEEDCEKLYEDTRDLFESYNKPDLKTREVRIPAGRTDLYYSAVRDEDNSGIELVRPDNIYMTHTRNTPCDLPPLPATRSTPCDLPPLPATPEHCLPQDNTFEDNDDYVYAAPPSVKSDTSSMTTSPMYTVFEQMNKSKQDQIDRLVSSVKGLRGDLDKMEKGYHELSRTMKGI